MTNPFVYLYGRRFLRDPTLPYPLPVDLAELHRQTLRTLTLMRVHGAPFCSPFFEDTAPKKVLEICCGSGLWSSACHDFFKRRGYPNVSFTGIDIAPLAPDLNEHGVNWRFVQHDLRKLPLPFAAGEFDFIFIKDNGLCVGTSEIQATSLSEPMRLLKPGGVLEGWDTDHLFRTLLPHPPIPPGTSDDDSEQAEDSATYIISSSTAFAKPQNAFLLEYNSWVEKALEKRHLTAVPCALMAWAFLSDPETLGNVGSRRVAVPFGEVRWEQEDVEEDTACTSRGDRRPSVLSAETEPNLERKVLTADQTALRRTALLTTIQFIEGLELILKEESGKRQDEWDRWWASMTNDLLEQNGTFSGECLEVAAWWGQKQ